VVRALPSVWVRWTGSNSEEKRSGSQAQALYAIIAQPLWFLCRAALYG